MIKGFRDFIMRGNVIDLAVAVICCLGGKPNQVSLVDAFSMYTTVGIYP